MVANTIVVMDEKGGAAKTTLSLLLAQALGNAGYKTCAGDLDGQCNLTTAAGVNEENFADFLKAGYSAAGISGRLLDKKVIAEGNYDELTRRAQTFVKIASEN